MRICLITPGHLSTNPRLVKEADALSEAGHGVMTLAASYLPWAMDADKSFRSRPWRVAPAVPFGPFAPRRWRLVQLTRQKVARALYRSGIQSALIARAACHPAGSDLASAAGDIKADLYVAHYLAALPAAALAAKRHAALYAFDAEDFHLGELAPGACDSLQSRLIDSIERRYLPGCAYVTAASPGIADAYVETYGIEQPTVVLNVFPRSQAPPSPTPAGSSALRPSVYWFSQTIGPDRGLESAVRAIGLARSRPHLHLRGAVSSPFAETLEAVAREAGAFDRLHLLPPAPPDDMARLASEFDLGLAAETAQTRNRSIALTNKLFTYFLAGIPAVASDIPAHRSLAEAAGGCVMLYQANDAQSLAAAIDQLLIDPAVLATARKAAFRLGQEQFNWDAEKHILIDRVARAFA